MVRESFPLDPYFTARIPSLWYFLPLLPKENLASSAKLLIIPTGSTLLAPPFDSAKRLKPPSNIPLQFLFRFTIPVKSYDTLIPE